MLGVLERISYCQSSDSDEVAFENECNISDIQRILISLLLSHSLCTATTSPNTAPVEEKKMEEGMSTLVREWREEK